ncbi:hypothetical protein EMIHUDRAFT_197879 [Emiliania huxleyi CCMP1516]|uniref:Cytochrome b5 heme-binding domain-containing protein n=2 Tax=Emiliania huxleyi TaxID=2903 RepID=A0A0D3IDW2_EMIH1|nr:hypothetical protein EMIHUDRAFT_197879 [Emiliania huxleyi CCMP1516]EOD09447.1 hypothetical protein EMIHUDRAFT_197879 [Emiliania huxleyi CCMP1516]|eukprot:XP_005761876.1 hypothetical protein EMIHUDRAFT_197879 [Emiliania huxleyi CCMP1516]
MRRLCVLSAGIMCACADQAAVDAHGRAEPNDAAAAADANARVFTSEELIEAAASNETLYAVVVGRVFNVTSGAQFYGSGGGYRGFADGRDASRAFLDTDFDAEGLDDLGNLTLSQCLEVNHWVNFYATHETYSLAGVHAGRFYDDGGAPTDAQRDFEACVHEADGRSAELQQLAKEVPKCAWQMGPPRSVSCVPPRVPLRIELPDEAAQCCCIHPDSLAPRLSGREAGNLRPRPYSSFGCTETESVCEMVRKKPNRPSSASD